MNIQHKAIRALLTTMSPNRATEYIKSFNLPEDEENCLIACDVQNKSCVQAGNAYGFSPDCVKKKRQKAYMKIADQINH